MRIPLDDLARAVEEQQALVGAHVDNVYQCAPRCFLLKLTPGPRHLVLDLTPGAARALVTDAPPPVPDRPPTFGAILRRALRGGRLTAVTLPAADRVVHYGVSTAAGERIVVVEALPRWGNLLLLDAAGVVERVLDGEAAKRRGNPIGAAYDAPRPPKIPAEASLVPADAAGPFAANHALDACARTAADEDDGVARERRRKRVRERIERARGKVDRDLRGLADPAALRKEGETLLAHFHELRAGMNKFRGIALDPKRQPHENVDLAFQRARKAERARPHLEGRQAELDELLRRLDAGEDVPEREIPGKKGGPPAPRKPYKTFTSATGRRILVGKGGRDNDETTMRVAGPRDIFLHVRGTPGAHVIVPLDRGAEIDQETLLDAATLALHYSKSRRAEKAEITYCPRRHVSKPKGAKPGLVQVARESVLFLRREPERLARLLMTAGDAE